MQQTMFVQLLRDSATLPVRSSTDAAGYDIASAEDAVIEPGRKGLIKTGLAIKMPDCPVPGHIYAMKLTSRSGLSWKKGVEVGAGLIDLDYRGELGVVLFNHHHEEPLVIKTGDRIAQGIIIAVAIPDVVQVAEITDVTERGTGGFGSTGI